VVITNLEAVYGGASKFLYVGLISITHFYDAPPHQFCSSQKNKNKIMCFTSFVSCLISLNRPPLHLASPTLYEFVIQLFGDATPSISLIIFTYHFYGRWFWIETVVPTHLG